MNLLNDPIAVATNAARGFPVLRCVECARAIQTALISAGHKGQLVTIRAAGGRDFLVCLSYDGGLRTITQSGIHVCVRIGDFAFDNLHPNGVAFDDWLKDFDALGGIAVVSVNDF